MATQAGLRKRKAHLLAILSRGLGRPPHRLAELSGVLAASPVDLKRAAAIIGGDAELAFDLLRLTNGALSADGRRVARVEDAAILLGAPALLHLALASFLVEASRENLLPAAIGSFWFHALTVARLSERATRGLALGVAEQAFVAGLLHDAGKLPLLMVAEAEHSSTSIWLASNGGKTLALEREYFGMDHCEAGQRLGLHWNLSPALLEAITWHHEPGRARAALDLVGIVAVADRFCAADRSTAAISAGDFVQTCLPRLGEARRKALVANLRREYPAARRFAEKKNPGLGRPGDRATQPGTIPRRNGDEMSGL